MSLLELYCHVDEFYQQFEPYWRQQLVSGPGQRRRRGQLSVSEILTIVIHFHQARYRDFKAYYLQYVAVQLRTEFPQLVSYQRFVELLPTIVVPLCAYLQACFGSCTGISFIDSTALPVCHNRRISQHHVFAGIAQRGKTSLGWFYGFKVHLVVNDCGELLGVQLNRATLTIGSQFLLLRVDSTANCSAGTHWVKAISPSPCSSAYSASLGSS